MEHRCVAVCAKSLVWVRVAVVRKNKCGCGSVVEHHLAKVRVASSNLVIRSKQALAGRRESMVEWLSGPKQQPAKL